MRGISAPASRRSLASCTTALTAAGRASRAAKQRNIEQLLAGKVAQPPVSCLPQLSHANDMT